MGSVIKFIIARLNNKVSNPLEIRLCFPESNMRVIIIVSNNKLSQASVAIQTVFCIHPLKYCASARTVGNHIMKRCSRRIMHVKLACNFYRFFQRICIIKKHSYKSGRRKILKIRVLVCGNNFFSVPLVGHIKRAANTGIINSVQGHVWSCKAQGF